ncbi:MAG: hypothetical protein CVT73_07990 [Alphaproteobacteria bacterium HGW-Alphaproteobacteria-12]|nr:MAG: hypothetical protein CVT73_07990 [Alphaproteobacteria bacterium HGW-Alphaproteobacteria-12]
MPNVEPEYETDIRYVPGWHKRDPKLERDAIALWKEFGALPENIAPEIRAREICCLAYDGDRLAGISTVDIKPCPPLRNRKFGFLRVFTRPDHEQQKIAIGLAIQCRAILEAWSLAQPGENLAGMAAIYQSAKLGRTPVGKSGLTLIGYTAEGHQLRVTWFNHVTL